MSVALNANEEERGGARWRVCVCVCGINQLAITVPCANVDSGCIAMAHRHAVVQAFQFDPESDPDGEAPNEEVATAGHLRMVSLKYGVWIRGLFMYAVTVIIM